jgi:hypothetical protein
MSDHVAGTHQKWCGAFIFDVVVPEERIELSRAYTQGILRLIKYYIDQ